MLVLFYLLYITAPLGSSPEVSAVSCREIKASEEKKKFLARNIGWI